MEAGTRFEATRDTTTYMATKKEVQTATSYYTRAGFPRASEYAKATYRIFDAYFYGYKAQTETDPKRKAQYYGMTERLLQASAASYLKANHSEKSQEIERLLVDVREESELATSLSEVLDAPAITSATTSFATPNPTEERAVGLERFDDADIQANLILFPKEVKIGDKIEVEIELFNAGRGPAMLVRVENIFPGNFKTREVSRTYRFEDHNLNMKRKVLGSLKTEEIRIVIEPMARGIFHVQPLICYMDESGGMKSKESGPVSVAVTELGMRGWLRGEG